MPLSWQLIAYLVFGGVGAAALFLSFASYSRIEVVSGTITPDAGIAPAVAARAGIVTEIAVKEGQLVAAGTPLATIRAEEEGATSQTPGALIEAAIARQDASLAMQINASLAAAEAQATQLAAQRAGLSAEIDQLRVQREAQARLIASAREDLVRATEVATRGFISKRDLQLREETLLSREQGMAQLDQALAAKRAALAENAQTIETVAAQARSQSASVEASRAQIAQQAASAAASRAYVLRAPVAGRVTALTARIGQPVSPGVQLLVVLPKRARLTAQLAVPSAAVGFIKPRQDVRLAIDAFPYSRFGTVRGKVRSVPLSAVTLPGPDGRTVAVYPVIVDINQTSISAYGNDEPLVPGMSLTARIVAEKQSLLEWLFEPLFAVRRR